MLAWYLPPWHRRLRPHGLGHRRGGRRARPRRQHPSPIRRPSWPRRAADVSRRPCTAVHGAAGSARQTTTRPWPGCRSPMIRAPGADRQIVIEAVADSRPGRVPPTSPSPPWPNCARKPNSTMRWWSKGPWTPSSNWRLAASHSARPRHRTGPQHPGPEEGADRLLPTDVISTAHTLVRTTMDACPEDQGHGPDGGRVPTGSTSAGRSVRTS